MLKTAITLLLVGVLWSCASAPKPKTTEDESKPTVPVERDYQVSFDVAWSAINEILEQYAMPIELTDKVNGGLETKFMGGDVSDDDYILETTTVIRRERSWIEETRHKLKMRVIRLAKRETRIQITAFIQGKYSTSTTSRYREGSWHNLISTGGIEMDMHELILDRLSRP